MTLAREIVTRLGALGQADLPDDVRETAKLHLLDVLGVGMAASAASIGASYRAYSSGLTATGRSSILGRDGGFSASDAVLVNGGLIHSLEFDDTHTGSIVHGSSVLAATALAVGEMTGATGEAVLKAYVHWYEVLIRIGLAAAGSFQDRGFQLTSVGGALCAAGIAAALEGLSEDAAVHALGIALSQASGVFEFLSNGSSVKSLHPGWAAHSGVTAAQLARAEMTGPETSLEGRFGLFATFSEDRGAAVRLDEALETLGSEWHFRDVAFKFYPCCHYIHPFIEAAEKLVADGVRPEMIKQIDFRVPRGAAGIICEPWTDKQSARGHAMRWSLPAVVAVRLADGILEADTFEHTPSPEARALAQRMTWQPLSRTAFPVRFEAEIDCRTTDGRSCSVRIEDAYGNHSRPPTADAVKRKFRDNMRAARGEGSADLLMNAIECLDAAPSLDDFSAALRGAAQQ